MNKMWLIADTHYDHNNIIKYENRPFESLEHMKESMIEAWNSVVKKHDKVYVLGDFSFKGYTKVIPIIERLNGYIHFIKGNHDRHDVYERITNEGYLVKFHTVGTYVKVDKLQFYLSHFPLGMGERPLMYNLHGHIHSVDGQFTNQINVGVDSKFMRKYYEEYNVPFGTPVSFEYILDKIKEV